MKLDFIKLNRAKIEDKNLKKWWKKFIEDHCDKKSIKTSKIY